MLVSITDLVAGRTAGPLPSRIGVPDIDAPAVVTWQLTRPGRWPGNGRELPCELGTDEGLSLVDAIAASGARELRLVGAPLARLDLFEFVSQARMHGLRTSIVTSGAWLTNATAERLRAYAVSDVHVELLAPSTTDGGTRRLEGGDVRAAAVGYLRCMAAGQEAALAVPLTPPAAAALEGVFDFAELHEVRRLMLLRLPVAHEAERGAAHAAVRSALTVALRRARRAVDRRQCLDVSIADDFLAAPFAVTLLARDERMRAHRALPLLESVLAGTRETRATVDAEGGVTLEPDGIALGDVRDRPFDVLWRQHAARAAAERSAVAEPAWPTPRCGPCQWVDVCGVHDRATDGELGRRAARSISESCYLTDDEVGLRGHRLREPPPLPGVPF